MFELYYGTAFTASDIIVMLEIDKGYLSRILRSFEKNKLMTKTGSPSDKRSIMLQLTAKGKKEFEGLDMASSRQVETAFKNLAVHDCDALVQKMKEIQSILNNNKLKQ